MKNRLWLFCAFIVSSWQEKVARLPHDVCVSVYECVDFYLLCVIKLLSWSFIHLINNSALEVEHRDPVFIGTR